MIGFMPPATKPRGRLAQTGLQRACCVDMFEWMFESLGCGDDTIQDIVALVGTGSVDSNTDFMVLFTWI